MFRAELDLKLIFNSFCLVFVLLCCAAFRPGVHFGPRAVVLTICFPSRPPRVRVGGRDVLLFSPKAPWAAQSTSILLFLFLLLALVF